MPRLLKRARRLKGRAVLVVADRDVAVGTLTEVLATLRQGGASPAIGGRGSEGLVALWPDDAPRDPKAPARAGAGERPPADVEALTVELDPRETTLVLQRRGGGYMRRTLRQLDELAAWAARVAAVSPSAQQALFAVAPEVPVHRLVAAVDAALSPCASAACTSQIRRMGRWQLLTLKPGGAAGERDAPEAPAAQPGRAAGVRVDRPRMPGGGAAQPNGLQPQALQHIHGARVDLDLRAPLPAPPKGRRLP